jgi:hypothetical protein
VVVVLDHYKKEQVYQEQLTLAAAAAAELEDLLRDQALVVQE